MIQQRGAIVPQYQIFVSTSARFHDATTISTIYSKSRELEESIPALYVLLNSRTRKDVFLFWRVDFNFYVEPSGINAFSLTELHFAK